MKGNCMRILTKNVYLKAAKIVAKTRILSCPAIWVAADDYFGEERHIYAELFRPTNEEYDMKNGEHLFMWFGKMNEKNQNRRVLALLFMHEITKENE
jgi:hypothetical protein